MDFCIKRIVIFALLYLKKLRFLVTYMKDKSAAKVAVCINKLKRIQKVIFFAFRDKHQLKDISTSVLNLFQLILRIANFHKN